MWIKFNGELTGCYHDEKPKKSILVSQFCIFLYELIVSGVNATTHFVFIWKEFLNWLQILIKAFLCYCQVDREEQGALGPLIYIALTYFLDACCLLYSFQSVLSSGWVAKCRPSCKICHTYCCCLREPCMKRIELSMTTSIYSKDGHPIMSGEALVVCNLKNCVIGSDICTLIGQVAELIKVGYNVTSLARCCTVAADVTQSPCILILWFRKYRRLVVFVMGIAMIDVSYGPFVSVHGSAESCKH